MIKIAIVEDDDNDAELLTRLLGEYAAARAHNFSVASMRIRSGFLTKAIRNPISYFSIYACRDCQEWTRRENCASVIPKS